MNLTIVFNFSDNHEEWNFNKICHRIHMGSWVFLGAYTSLLLFGTLIQKLIYLISDFISYNPLFFLKI